MARRKRRKAVDIIRGKRPLGVALITLLEVIAAIYLFLGAASFSLIRYFIGFGNIVSVVAGFGVALLLIMGIVLLFSAYGLWRGTSWGWWLGIVISGFMIISIVFLDVIGLVLGLAFVFYLTRKRVKKWFVV